MTGILITSSVLILALLAVRQLFRHTMSRRVQYALWGLVLLRLLVPGSLFSAPVSLLSAAAPVEQSVAAAPKVYVLPVARPSLSEYPSAQREELKPGDRVPSGDSFGYLVVNRDGATATRYAAHMELSQVLGLIWRAGMALMGGWFLLSNLLFWRKLRTVRTPYEQTQVSRPVYLVPHGVLPSPCLFGRSIYLTPAAVEDPDRLRHVLLHEETHARHWDPLWSLLQCLCLVIYWFDPLVWAAAACVKADRELACDESVLRRLDHDERIGYGETLLSLIPVRRSAQPLLSATTMTAGKRQLKDRITRIAQRPRQLAAATAAAAILAGVLCVCAFAGSAPSPAKAPADGWELTATIPLSGAAPAEGPLTGDEVLALDLDGDGVEEQVLGPVLHFQKGGTTYEADLKALLPGACPELSFWDNERWDPSSKRLLVTGCGGDSETHGYMWQRALSFDGQSILVWRYVKPTYDHMVEGAADGVPEQVVAAAKSYVESLLEPQGDGTWLRSDRGSYADLQYPIDDWRIESFTGSSSDTLGNVTVEGWAFNYELHTPAPERVVWAGGLYVTEDGWVSPGYPGCDWLFFRLSGAGGKNRALLWHEMINDMSPQAPAWRPHLARQLEKLGLDLGSVTSAAVEVQHDFDLIFDHSGGQAILQLIPTGGEGGGSYTLDPSAGNGPNRRMYFTQPGVFLWRQTPAPAQTPPGASLVFTDPYWHQVLQFWEGSDLVMSMGDAGPVWYTAESATPPASEGYEQSRIFPFMRLWYDEAEFTSLRAAAMAKLAPHSPDDLSAARAFAGAWESAHLSVTPGSTMAFSWQTLTDTSVSDLPGGERQIMYTLVFVPENDAAWDYCWAGNTEEYHGGDPSIPAGALQFSRVLRLTPSEGAWSVTGYGTG